MKRGQYIRWWNYQNTVLAVYWLSEPDGMRCYASTAQLAAETGLSAPAVRCHLARLRMNHVILRAQVPDRNGRRALALLDHSEPLKYLKSNMEYWGPLSAQVELNRERAKAATPDESRSVVEAKS